MKKDPGYGIELKLSSTGKPKWFWVRGGPYATVAEAQKAANDANKRDGYR